MKSECRNRSHLYYGYHQILSFRYKMTLFITNKKVRWCFRSLSFFSIYFRMHPNIHFFPVATHSSTHQLLSTFFVLFSVLTLCREHKKGSNFLLERVSMYALIRNRFVIRLKVIYSDGFFSELFYSLCCCQWWWHLLLFLALYIFFDGSAWVR